MKTTPAGNFFRKGRTYTPMKLLTVTVPCYNSAAYMRKCIDSLLAGGERMEIIVIDDGSKDDTGAIADEYAEKYPDIVRAVHQPNGGHGEGINQGVAHATGRYFKVVDSDDWVDRDALLAVLGRLESAEAEGGIDMLVTNYVYEYEDGRKSDCIRYGNVFPEEGKIVSWDRTRRFRLKQYITLHSVIYRTEILQEMNYRLPGHISYEDNLYIYAPLPRVKRLCYLNADLYRYLIGRDGQSVSEKNMIRKSSDQRLVTERVFGLYDLEAIKKKSPELYRVMWHELWLMMSIGSLFTRLGNSDECDREMFAMWDRCREKNPREVNRLRRRGMLAFICIPGRLGRVLAIFFYRVAHGVVNFN